MVTNTDRNHSAIDGLAQQLVKERFAVTAAGLVAIGDASTLSLGDGERESLSREGGVDDGSHAALGDQGTQTEYLQMAGAGEQHQPIGQRLE